MFNAAMTAIDEEDTSRDLKVLAIKAGSSVYITFLTCSSFSAYFFVREFITGS